jgi:hypothetical protein
MFNYISIFIFCAFAGGFLQQCNPDNKYPEINNNIASPIAAVRGEAGEVFVLNANYLHNEYEGGNIVRVNTDTKKIDSHVQAPRMGRMLAYSGGYLFAIFENNNNNELRVFDVSSPEKIELKRTWSFKKSTHKPFNIVAGKDFFAVTCLDGSLYVGKKIGSVDTWKFEKIRQYSGARRRAMHIHEQDDFKGLFVFASNDLYSGGESYSDKNTYDIDGGVTSESPSGGPDAIEERSRSTIEKLNRYQLAIVDLEKVEEENFTEKKFEDFFSKEIWWMSLTEENSNNILKDSSKYTKQTKERFFISNFWDAKADLKESEAGKINMLLTLRNGDSKQLVDSNILMSMQVNVDLIKQRSAGGSLSSNEINEVFTYDLIYHSDNKKYYTSVDTIKDDGSGEIAYAIHSSRGHEQELSGDKSYDLIFVFGSKENKIEEHKKNAEDSFCSLVLTDFSGNKLTGLTSLLYSHKINIIEASKSEIKTIPML